MLWSMVSPSTSVSDVHVWDGTRPDRAPRRNRSSHRLARRRVDPPRAPSRAPDDRRVRRRGGLLRSHGADLRVGHREPRPGRGVRLRRPRAAAHTCGSRCRSCGWPRRRSTRRHRTWSATRIRRSSPGGCWCTAGTDRPAQRRLRDQPQVLVRPGHDRRFRRSRAADLRPVPDRARRTQAVAAQARLASFQVAELTSSQAWARSCVRTAAGTTVPVMFAW